MKETKNRSTALFHNKYFMELDHVVMDCIEERIVDMNKREYEMEYSGSTQDHSSSLNKAVSLVPRLSGARGKR